VNDGRRQRGAGVWSRLGRDGERADVRRLRSMLDLDSPRWSELTHAYGAASDIPDRLRAVAKHPNPKKKYTDEPWFTLWSSLYHQGNIYTASYAAVPHLVRIASQIEGPCAWDLFALPASIEAVRLRGPAPPLPDFISEGSLAALHALHEAASRHGNHAWDHVFAQAVLAALAAATGNGLLADV